jgi:hypothetical protein
MAGLVELATRAAPVALVRRAIPALLGLAEILAQQGTPVALALLVLLGPQARRAQGLQQGRLEIRATLVLLVALEHRALLGQRHLSFR